MLAKNIHWKEGSIFYLGNSVSKTVLSTSYRFWIISPLFVGKFCLDFPFSFLSFPFILYRSLSLSLMRPKFNFCIIKTDSRKPSSGYPKKSDFKAWYRLTVYAISFHLRLRSPSIVTSQSVSIAVPWAEGNYIYNAFLKRSFFLSKFWKCSSNSFELLKYKYNLLSVSSQNKDLLHVHRLQGSSFLLSNTKMDKDRKDIEAEFSVNNILHIESIDQSTE